jgi:hypothetical protein
MERTQAGTSASKPIHWSIRTVLIGGVFVVMLAGAVVVDTDAVLQYLDAVSGSAPTMLEYGSIITILAAIPFLALGLSIDDDEMHPAT